jgi:hypothetical protein
VTARSSVSTRCTATTAAQQPCRAWAVQGSDPPLCAAHGGRGKRPGAPNGNANAVTHGAYAHLPARQAAGESGGGIESQIDDLDRRIARLGQYIDEHAADLDPVDLVRLLDLHSKMIGRVTRVRQAQQTLTGDQNAALTAAMNRALDRIGKELKIDL